MSEETKNPLIESFLKTHNRKLVESGGAGIAMKDRALQYKKEQDNQKTTDRMLAREPKEAPSSFGSQVQQGLGAADAAVRRFASGMGGDYIAAAGDTVLKKTGSALGITNPVTTGWKDTFTKELGDEQEKTRRAAVNHPTAAAVGDVADTASTVAGAAAIGKGLVKYGLKYGTKLLAKSGDDIAAKGAKGLEGEILPKGTKLGDNAKDITPSSSTAVATVGKTVSKSADDVSKDLSGWGKVPAGAKALPSAGETTKALGGFSKVPSLGKIAAVGAGAAAGTAALTAGSNSAGEPKADTTPPAAKQPEKYKIAKGDNLSTLAQKWGVSVGDIMKSNQGIKDPNKIYAGADLVKPERTGNPIYKDGIGTKAGPKKSQNLQKEESDMTNPLISAFLKLQETKTSNMFESAKKLDRREAIGKAIEEAKDPNAENDGGVYKSPPRPMTDEEKPKPKVGNSVVKQTGKNSSEVSKSTNEEVEFSAEEIAHITAVLEANPVAPSSDENKAFGKSASRSGTLSDETLPKNKLKEEVEELDEEEKRKRGRPKGSKSGARTKAGERSADGGAAGASPGVPHIVHQIRHGSPDSSGHYTLQHHAGNDKSGAAIIHTARVHAKDAVSFYGDYHGSEKPAEKERKTASFVGKHFGITPPASKPGISLPKMPAPKS